MTSRQRFSRRAFVKAGAVGAGALLAACAPKVVTEIVKETVVVEKEKVVEKPVEKVVQQEVTRVVVQQATKEPVTLRLHYRAGGETSEVPIYITRPKEFTEETGIQVKLEPIPGGEYWAKIETLAAGGSLGDNMFTTEQGWYHSRMVHFGILAPIDSIMEARGVKRDEWLPGVISTCTFGGKTYGLPKGAHPGYAYVWINHSLFEEAGLAIPPTYGVTWEQIADWAKKLSKGPAEKRDQYGFYCPWGDFQSVTNWVHDYGADEVEEDGVSVKADADGWKQPVRWSHQAIVKDRVAPVASELGSAGVLGLFAAGKLGMWYSARSDQSQVIAAVGKYEGKFKWSVIAVPRSPAFKAWPLSLNTHAGTMQSQHKEESFLLTYALSDKRFAELVANEQGYLVGRTNEMDEIGKAKDDPFIQLQYGETKQGVAYRVGKNLRGSEYDKAIRNSLDAVFLGKQEPDDAFFGTLNTTLNEILQKPVP